jgi:hypothetical protein
LNGSSYSTAKNTAVSRSTMIVEDLHGICWFVSLLNGAMLTPNPNSGVQTGCQYVVLICLPYALFGMELPPRRVQHREESLPFASGFWSEDSRV